MKFTKSIFLFLLLVLPVLIYLFLQGFGENKFAIPVYYNQGLDQSLSDCEQTKQPGPYRVDPQAISKTLDTDVSGMITVFELGNSHTAQLKNNLYTFLDKYKSHETIRLISVLRANDSMAYTSRYASWMRFNLPDSDLMRLGRCILQMDLDNQFVADSGLVLVDQKQQIRGYYDPMELKEIDRLNTELYILLSE